MVDRGEKQDKSKRDTMSVKSANLEIQKLNCTWSCRLNIRDL